MRTPSPSEPASVCEHQKRRRRRNIRSKEERLRIRQEAMMASAPETSQPAPAGNQEDEIYDVVVIGSGGGGLSAAAQLATNHDHPMKVLVLEQHYNLGGYMTSFERQGYHFEVSLHAMDVSGLKAMKKLGIELIDEESQEEPEDKNKIKLIKLEQPWKFYFQDFTLDVPSDPNKFRQNLKEIFPQEGANIDRLFGDLEKFLSGIKCLSTMSEGGLYNTSQVVWKMITTPSIPWLFAKNWNASATEFLHNYTKDEKLVSVMTQLCAYLGSAPGEVTALMYAAMWTTYHFEGYHYLRGGSQSVTNALVHKIRQHGGEALTKKWVNKIVVQDNRAVAVQTKDGSEYKCRYVVSNANAPDTAMSLIGVEHLPDDYLQRIESMTIGSLSMFCVYLGVDHDYTDAYPTGCHSLSEVTSYDTDQEYAKIREDPDPEKISFGIFNYSKVEPACAPPGKNCINLIALMPYDYNGDWCKTKDKAEGKALQQEVARKLIKRTERYLPGLSDHIEVMEVATPLTLEKFTLNPNGAYVGWEYSKEQSNIMGGRLDQTTPIPNLYLAGAWTFPGGGQSCVLQSGIAAAERILHDDTKSSSK